MRQLYRWLNILFFLGVIVLNTISATRGLFGTTTKEVSDAYHVAVTPAGYAFSIWSLIYVLLAGFVIVQALPGRQNDSVIRDTGPWFVLSCIFNMSWILAWHSEMIGLSTALMAALLITLIALYVRTRPAAASTDRVSRWLIALPFSIYLGWISVASIVNFTIFFMDAGFNGFGLDPDIWAILLFVIAAVLAVWIGRKFVDPFYGLVIVWALIAIGVEQRTDEPTVAWAAWIIAVVILLFDLWLMANRLRQQRR
ncbi:TspO/MBR family protein [Paenibacillus gansuensis]|uniref:Tryptophan-rich sensory protein n=1 Tax=Paenibacillus gansuensis TaxID=306542 RepID=A0ABW5PHN4_9BACL